MEQFAAKALASITLDDLRGLLENEVSESLNLDYKRELNLDGRDDRKEFLRDLSSFANAQGGLLIYGMDEERDVDGKPTGIPKEVAGFAESNPDSLVQKIEHIIKDGIEDRLPSYDLYLLAVDTGRIVLMIRIAPSVRAPHMVVYGGERRFFARTNSGKQEMSVTQIRDAVIKTQSLEDRILGFVRERVVAWSAKTPEPFWLMHVIPVTSSRTALDVTDPNLVTRLGSAMNGIVFGSYYSHHCLEGFKIYSGAGAGRQVTFFRNGGIEFYDQMALHRRDKSLLFAYAAFDKYVFQLFTGALGLYREGHLQLPAAVCITLQRVKGCTLPGERYRTILPAGLQEAEQVIVDPIVLLDLPSDPSRELRPALDLIWNAFGHQRCPGYDKDGKYVGYGE
jgi:hypothetical protein